LPWYGIDDGFFTFEWLFDGYPLDPDYAPALFLLAQGEKLWLAPIALFLLLPFATWNRQRTSDSFSTILMIAGAGGLASFWRRASPSASADGSSTYWLRSSAISATGSSAWAAAHS
jgi:hypothetical protein